MRHYRGYVIARRRTNIRWYLQISKGDSVISYAETFAEACEIIDVWESN